MNYFLKTTLCVTMRMNAKTTLAYFTKHALIYLEGKRIYTDVKCDVKLFVFSYTCILKPIQRKRSCSTYYKQPDSCCEMETAPTCGYRPVESGRIINGVASNEKLWPWMAYILLSSNGNLELCSGTFISDTWILTAYHCIKKHSPSNLDITAGVMDGRTVSSSDGTPPRVRIFLFKNVFQNLAN